MRLGREARFNGAMDWDLKHVLLSQDSFWLRVAL